MATCVAQQSSQSTLNDTIKMSMSCRKRLLSEQNDRNISYMKHPNDAVGKIKTLKTSKHVIFFLMRRAQDIEKNDICFRLHSRSFSNFLPPTCDKAKNITYLVFFFFQLFRFISSWLKKYTPSVWDAIFFPRAFREKTPFSFSFYLLLTSSKSESSFAFRLYKRQCIDTNHYSFTFNIINTSENNNNRRKYASLSTNTHSYCQQRSW